MSTRKDSIRVARLAVAAGITVTSDLDRMTERTPELVRSVSVPIFAEHLPPLLTGERDPERCAAETAKAPLRPLCVTLGTNGAMALDGDRIIHSPAFAVNAVDTTGSGDVFRAGFVYATLAGWPTAEVLRFSNAAAAVSVTRSAQWPAHRHSPKSKPCSSTATPLRSRRPHA